MKYFIYILAIVLLFGLNLGLFNNLQIKGQIPNLLFLLCLNFTFEKNDLSFLFVSFFSGLILDFYSTTFFGCFTLSFLILFFLLHIVITSFVVVEVNWKSLSIALLFCLFGLDVLVWMCSGVAFRFNWTQDFSSLTQYTSAFPANLIYNLLLLYPVYLFSIFLKNFTDSLSVRRRSVIR